MLPGRTIKHKRQGADEAGYQRAITEDAEYDCKHVLLSLSRLKIGSRGTVRTYVFSINSRAPNTSSATLE